jgi:F-box domain
MSERTISPGMDHINPVPSIASLEKGISSPSAGRFGPVKRKWSPDHSVASTPTLTGHQEIYRANDTASPPDADSQRHFKRPKSEKGQDAHQEEPSSDVLHRTSTDRSELPGEMWQHIFTYLPPYVLGRLMLVNKTFRVLLTQEDNLPEQQLPPGRLLTLLKPEHLWSLSRRSFFPGMPRPMPSRSELQTWKLVRGQGCQFCGRTNTGAVPPVSSSPWAAGPGNDYVRIIWPFGVRSCSNCLREHLQKVGFFMPCSRFVISNKRNRKPNCFSPITLHCYLPFLSHSSRRL